MPPKAQKQPTKAQAKPAGKAAKKNKKEDDDDALLEQQMKVAEADAKKLAKEQAKVDQEKAKKAKELAQKEAAALKAHEAAMAKLPPVTINEVAQKIWELQGGDNCTFREMCWLSYVINNFLSYCVENRRVVAVKTAQEPEKGEVLSSFAVHDLTADSNSPHSWNVVTCSSGSYAVDVSLKQFGTAGRYGFKKATEITEEPYVPVRFPSRLKKEGADAVHAGSVATDKGILPEKGTIKVKEGVARGTFDKYSAFLKAASCARYQRMSEGERKTAEILHRQHAIDKFLSLHDDLVAHFFPKAEKAE